MPQGRKAAFKLFCWLSPILPGVNGLFRLSLKDRDEEKALYDSPALMWTPVMGLLGRRTSRNKMDADRNDPAYAANVLLLAQQTDWVDGEEKTVPSTQLVCDWLAKARLRYLHKLLEQLFLRFVDMKLFANATFCGCFVLVLDATKVEERRGSGLLGWRRNRMALEAKVITPWGWAITVAVEPMRPWRSDSEKQDCELGALKRMSGRLKRIFGRRGVILMGDALYACRPVLDICRRNGWHYVFVFKEGRSPSIFGEAQSLLDLAEGQWGRMVRDVRKKKECVVGGVRWAKDVPFGEYKTNVVEIHQMVASDDSGAYYGQFMTDLEVNDARRALEIGTWGRHRWLIESSFKTEKREGEDGFGLEHTFCRDENASRAMHLLMQFAHNVSQVFNSGFLRTLSTGCRKVSQGMWGKKICEALHYYDYTATELETAYMNHAYEDAYLLTS